MRARASRPSMNFTRTAADPLTTCALVTTWPAPSQMTPDPAPWGRSTSSWVSTSVRAVRDETHTTPDWALLNRSTWTASSLVRGGWWVAGVGRARAGAAGGTVMVVVLVVDRAAASRGVAASMRAARAAAAAREARGGGEGASGVRVAEGGGVEVRGERGRGTWVTSAGARTGAARACIPAARQGRACIVCVQGLVGELACRPAGGPGGRG